MCAARGPCAAPAPTAGHLTTGAPSASSQRQQEHPRTPDKTQKLSKRRWDGLVRAWRRKLHEWDVAESAAGAAPAPATAPPAANGDAVPEPAPVPAPAGSAAPSAKAPPKEGGEEDELDAIERELAGAGAESGEAKLTESDLKMFEDDDLL